MYRLLPLLERWLRRLPWLWRKLEVNIPIPEIIEHELVNHAVIVGYGRVGKHLVDVLQSLAIPLLVIDSWEHAYYLQYKNVKADWVKAFWNVVNWKKVNELYKKAK